MPIPFRPWPCLLIGLVLTPASAVAQGTGDASSLALEMNRFYTGRGPLLVEGAVEIPYPLLTFSADSGNLSAQAKVEVMIDSPSGEQVYRTEREIAPEAVNPDMAGSHRVSSIETFAIYAPPGEYVARARVTDLKSGRTYETSAPLVLPAEPPLFSDFVLSSDVQKGVRLHEGSYLPYLIGTTMFSPNPRRVFYKDSPILYFYYEVNPEALKSETGRLELAMVIRDSSDEIVKKVGDREIKFSDDRNFDLGGFSIAGLSPGQYRLEVSCSECAGAPVGVSSFRVEPPRTEQLAFVTLGTETGEPGGEVGEGVKYYPDLSPAQVDSVIDVVEILLSAQQKNLVESLNRTGKITFLNRFWDSLDADPETPENEFKREFEQRVAYANQFFSSIQLPGHESDRGRIYILFGEPTEIIDRPLEATVGPYVIWNYASPGHTFAFGDFSKDGNYRLIYSTHERFPGDPTIQNLVDTDTSTSLPTFLRTGRGYEKVILDIRQNRTQTARAF